MKFKHGDKVKIKKGFLRGKTGEIIMYDYGLSGILRSYMVKFNDKNKTLTNSVSWFKESELAYIEENKEKENNKRESLIMEKFAWMILSLIHMVGLCILASASLTYNNLTGSIIFISLMTLLCWKGYDRVSDKLGDEK